MQQTETPWTPSAEYLQRLPKKYVILLSPRGISHLMLDDLGQWWHLVVAGKRLITAGQAAHLRPSDVDQVIKASLVWSLRQGQGNARALRLVDELADGVKRLLVAYAVRGGERPVDTGAGS